MGEQKLSDIPGLHEKVFSCVLDNRFEAGETFEIPLITAEEDIEIKEIVIVPNVSQAGSPGNMITRSVVNKGLDGAGVVDIAKRVFDTAYDLLAFQPYTLPLLNGNVKKGETVAYVREAIEFGKTVLNVCIRIAYQYKQVDP